LVDSQYFDTDRTFLGWCVASANGVADVPVRGLHGLYSPACRGLDEFAQCGKSAGKSRGSWKYVVDLQ